MGYHQFDNIGNWRKLADTNKCVKKNGLLKYNYILSVFKTNVDIAALITNSKRQE